jgi:hypothetical protein
MKHLIILSVVACSTYYILAYSRILAWLRPRFPRIVQEMLTCSACSGFWLGAWGGLALHPLLDAAPTGPVLAWLAQPFLGPDTAVMTAPAQWLTSVWLAALWCCTTTPILFKVMLTSLDFLAADLRAANAAEDDSNAPQEE